MKIFLYKVLIFAFLVIVLQLLIYSFKPSAVANSVSEGFATNFDNLSSPKDILYFGDSIIERVAATDTDKRTLPQMTSDLVKPLTVAAIAQAASQPDIYLAYSKYIAGRRVKPQAIIIPVNIRSFSPEWDLRPEYQFERERLFLNLAKYPLGVAAYNPLAVFKADQLLNGASADNFNNTPIYIGKHKIALVRDIMKIDSFKYSPEEFKKIIAFEYLQPVSPGHRKIKSLRDIIDCFREYPVNLIFYFTPLDYQTIQENFGPEITAVIKENIRVVKSVLKGPNVKVLDLSYSLPSADFVWKTEGPINEHLGDKGRLSVASQIAKAVQ